MRLTGNINIHSRHQDWFAFNELRMICLDGNGWPLAEIDGRETPRQQAKLYHEIFMLAEMREARHVILRNKFRLILLRRARLCVINFFLV